VHTKIKYKFTKCKVVSFSSLYSLRDNGETDKLGKAESTKDLGMVLMPSVAIFICLHICLVTVIGILDSIVFSRI